MLLHVPNVLTAEQVAECRRQLDAADWVDGRVTAGHQSAKAKDNVQLPEDSAGGARNSGDMILGRAGAQSAVRRRRRCRCKSSRRCSIAMQGGQSFGTHVDNAIRQVARHAAPHPHRHLGDAVSRRSRRNTTAAN